MTLHSSDRPNAAAGANGFHVPVPRPLIVHVHVPKTAGSAINACLSRCAGPGRDHVQQLIGFAEAFARCLPGCSWIAGHVPLPDFEVALRPVGRQIAFVTALREPARQVASHYNWLIEIGRRGAPFLAGHPPAVQEIHRVIATSDNGDPRTVIRNLERFSGLFMNCQARHAIGPDHDDPACSFRERLQTYSAVILGGDIGGGLAPLLGRPVDDVPPVNASRHHFERAVFHDPAVREFLSDRNRHDALLWREAQRLGPREPVREAMRR